MGRRFRALLALVAVSVLVVGACSSDDDGAHSPTTTTVTEREPTRPAGSVAVPVPEVRQLADPGKGATVLGPADVDLATMGYEEHELVVAGTATAYTSAGPLSPDGRWSVTPDAAASAPYTTRVVVRRPADPAAFDGTVYVEWLNVSGGLDADPMWDFAGVELVRSGAAWVGVSAQKVGIEGGGNALGAALALKNADPARYGELSHPGDDWSYDIYSQVGMAVWDDAATVLGGLEPRRVIAMGESQSAIRLTTYTDAVQPLVDVYDGIVQHSRGARGAALSTAPRADVPAPSPTLVRTDLDVPVFVIVAETDVAGDRLGYGRARQPDTDLVRAWEMAGTSHADAYSLGLGGQDDGSGAADAALFEAMRNPPSSVYGGVITCEAPINAGPHTYVLRTVLHDIDRWIATGEAPPSQPPLEIDAAGTDYVRDGNGIALGGVRTPQVDVPVARLSGLGQSGAGFCFLFGTTVPFHAAALAAAYPDHQAFTVRWDQAVGRAVDAGVLLDADAQRLRQVAAASTIGR